MSQTVLLTGITGFIAKHIAAKLLDAGYRVRGSLRDPDRADEVRAAVAPALKDAGGLDDRLDFVALDLTRDDGWDAAMAGVQALVHTASPFPLEQPRDETLLIRPAVEGAERALGAAARAGVRRAVLTSSAVAVMYSAGPTSGAAYNEDDWTDLDHPTANAYVRSKTLAERAAWDFVRNTVPDMALTAINPTLVLGAPLDVHFGSSLRIVQRMLSGKDPMVPGISIPVVDVQDVAEMHLRALQRPATAGKRYLAADSTMWFTQMARVLADAYPDRKISTRKAPDFLIRLIGLFDASARSIVPTLGREFRVTADRARADLEMTFTPAEDALRSTADWLVRAGSV